MIADEQKRLSDQVSAWKREISRLEDLIAHATGNPAAEMMSWRTIETAPKDGTEVLGWREDAGIFMVRWTAPINFLTDQELEQGDGCDDEVEDWFCADFVAGCRLDGREAPTHWMPLPQPPAEQGE